MEIDITRFVKTVEPCEFSASKMEFGDNAAKITWENAKREASESPLITENDREDFERWASEFGAWNKEEIEAWSMDECNALLIQYISHDLRELESLCYSDDDEYGIDWEHARGLSDDGVIGGNVYKGDDGRLYFYMGS